VDLDKSRIRGQGAAVVLLRVLLLARCLLLLLLNSRSGLGIVPIGVVDKHAGLVLTVLVFFPPLVAAILQLELVQYFQF